MKRWFRVISITGLILIFLSPAIQLAEKSGTVAMLVTICISGYGAFELAHLCDLAIRYLQLKIHKNWKDIKELDEN